jgi:hypothetical protein
MNSKDELKSACLHSNNHGIPKIADSKTTLTIILWSLAFTSSIIYTFIFIVDDLITSGQFKKDTYVNITNPILDRIPTVSICSDSIFRNTSFSIILDDCEIKREKYLEPEKCQNSSFFKSRSDCYTFNMSVPVLISDDSNDVNMKLTFKITNETNKTGIFVIPHDPYRLPTQPSVNRQKIDLFKCGSGTRISYSIKKQRKSLKLPKPYNKCVKNWSTVLKNITEQLQNKLDEYEEELCLLTCEQNLNISAKECALLCPNECLTKSKIFAKSIICEDTDSIISTVLVHFQDLKFTNVKERPAYDFEYILGCIG